jgi:RND superfamily putative drug exporter
LVIVAWLVAMLVIILVANATGRPTSNNTTIPGSDSEKATELLQKKLPAQANGSVPIVLEASKGTTLTDATNVTAINDAVESLSKNSNVANAVSPLMEGSKALNADATIGFISLTLTESPDDLGEDEAKTVLADADTARRQGDIKVSAGGYLGTQLSTPGTRASEVVGIVAAMIVLLFALGTLTAMTMPITTAIVGVFGGLAVIGALGTGFQVPTISPTVAAMLGLGVGVDYSLFITTRHMRLLRDGHEVKEAVARSIATSGGAVAFAGGTVIIALLCLFFGGIPIVTELLDRNRRGGRDSHGAGAAPGDALAAGPSHSLRPDSGLNHTGRGGRRPRLRPAGGFRWPPFDPLLGGRSVDSGRAGDPSLRHLARCPGQRAAVGVDHAAQGL